MAQKKEIKASKKKPVNYRAVARRWMARPVAFLTLFVLATYGLRQLFKSVPEQAAGGLTVLVIGLLVYIIVFED